MKINFETKHRIELRELRSVVVASGRILVKLEPKLLRDSGTSCVDNFGAPFRRRLFDLLTVHAKR